jgi:hypothetical protein
MPRTTNKGVRFTDEELQHVQNLLAQFPEYSSESDLLHHAAILGILVLATYASRPGSSAYAGYPPDDLAALLKPRLMPAINFLIERGALPMLFAAQLTGGFSLSAPIVTAEERGAETAIDEAAAEDLEGLGTGFMDDV